MIRLRRGKVAGARLPAHRHLGEHARRRARRSSRRARCSPAGRAGRGRRRRPRPCRSPARRRGRRRRCHAPGPRRRRSPPRRGAAAICAANFRPATEALREPTTAMPGLRKAGGVRRGRRSAAAAPSMCAEPRRIVRPRRRPRSARRSRRAAASSRSASATGGRCGCARPPRPASSGSASSAAPRDAEMAEQFAESDRADVLAADQAEPGEALVVASSPDRRRCADVHRFSPIRLSVPAVSRRILSAWRHHRARSARRRAAAAARWPATKQDERRHQTGGQRRQRGEARTAPQSPARPRADDGDRPGEAGEHADDRWRRPCRP